MLRPRKRPNLLNYIRLTDFAASAGVTAEAVHAWLAKPKIDSEVRAFVEDQIGQPVPKAHRLEFEDFLRDLKITHPVLFRRLKSNRTKCMSYGIVYKGKAYISLQGAERYLADRVLPSVAHRPENGITMKTAVDLIPYGKWKLYRAVFAGEIKAAIYSQTIYLDRESLMHYKLEQKSLLPLPGWISIRDAAKQAHRSYMSLRGWLKRNDKPMRVFMHPELNRLCSYMKISDLDTYRGLTKTPVAMWSWLSTTDKNYRGNNQPQKELFDEKAI